MHTAVCQSACTRAFPSKRALHVPAPVLTPCGARQLCFLTAPSRHGVPGGQASAQSAGFAKRLQTVATSASLGTPFVTTQPFKMQLLRVGVGNGAKGNKLLVFVPGTDGSGQAITPQANRLNELGYDVWSLFTPPDDRSGWEELTTQATLLLRQLVSQSEGVSLGGQRPQITLVAESFGCCLALRIAGSPGVQSQQLLESMVLLNSATSFSRSLAGLSSFIAATNLLALFPQDLFAAAQATLLPLLVDTARVDAQNTQLLRKMILMEPPASSQALNRVGDPLLASGPTGSTPAMTTTTLQRLAGGFAGGLLYQPAAAANFRANLLRSGDVPGEVLARITTPTLVISSAKDRMLPAIAEGARLASLLPNARRLLLPDSGHAALLERDVNLADIMVRTGFAQPPGIHKHYPQPQQATPGTNNGHGSLPNAAAPSVAASSAVTPASTSAVATATMAMDAASTTIPCSGDQDTGSNAAPARLPASAAPHAGPHQGECAPMPASSGHGSGIHATGAPSSSSSISGNGDVSRSAEGNMASVRPQQAGKGSHGGGGGAGSAEADDDVGQFTSAFDEWCQTLAPWRDLVSPVVLGQENLPQPGTPEFDRPMLFVGNHQRVGFYDTPLLVYEMYVRGYRVRGLAHPGHWSGPFGPWFAQFGAVKASPMAAFRLLKAKEKVLLFPGGAKEVAKRRGQEYTLIWKDTPDFVRLAAKCGALVVPFAAVGADDAYDVLMDPQEVLDNGVLGPLMRGLVERFDASLKPEEAVMPITRLPVLGLPTPIPIPNLQRLYFKFGTPIDAAKVNVRNADQVSELYSHVKMDVEQLLSELLEVRAGDDESQVSGRLAKALGRWLPLFDTSGKANTDTNTNTDMDSSSSSSSNSERIVADTPTLPGSTAARPQERV